MFRILCILLAVLLAASTLAWVMLDRSPPAWDDAWYLTNSLTVYDALTQGGIAGYLTKLNSVFGFKAPLIAALPAPFYLVLGRRWHAAYLVNIASMLLLFAALYRLALRWWNSRTAVFAIAIAGTMPLLYGLARWYMVEYALTALIALAICALVESEYLWFGVLSGFGLLLKISYPLFVLPVFLCVWIRSAHRRRNLLLTAIPCLAIALPWYMGHVGPTLANAFDAGFGGPAAIQGTGPIFAIRSVAVYLSHVLANGVSWYFFVLALLLCPWAFRRGAEKQAAPLLAAWLLPFGFFVFGGNKDVRYIAPLLPAAALTLAYLMDAALPRSRRGTAGALALLAFPLLQMCAVSFGIPYAVAGSGYTRKFNSRPWPQEEIVRLIAGNAELRPGAGPRILVGTDRGSFNANNFELTVVALELAFRVETTAHERDFGVLRERLTQSDFVLFKDGGEPESADFNPYAGELARIAAGDGRFREIPYSRRMPDGGLLRIYQRLARGPEIAEEFAVDFGGMIALTGMSVVTKGNEMDAKFRWRCTRPPDRAYWCFLHVIDSANHIVAQRDHRLLEGQTPLRRAGDAGEEEVVLPQASGLRLRFGIYDPASGERLGVSPLSGTAASRFTLTDQGTGLVTRD